jgi:hypothetical protein
MADMFAWQEAPNAINARSQHGASITKKLIRKSLSGNKVLNCL